MPGPLSDAIANPGTFATADGYAAVPGSLLDTGVGAGTHIGYRVAAATNGATAKMQASMDGTNWLDVIARKEDGTAQAAVDVAVAAGADEYLIVTPAHDSGAKAAFRYYQVQARSTVAGNSSTVTLDGMAK